MKKVILIITAIFSTYIINAQAVESKFKYNKVEQTGVTAEFVSDIDIVEKVIADDLKTRGFGKGKSSKGFTLYEAINFNEISKDKIDLYIKTEKKSKKEKEKTIVSVLVSKGYDNFINSATEPQMLASIINYVNGLKPKLEVGNLEAQIKEQEDLVKKEEKKHSNLIDDASNLEKKKRKIEEDIANNKKDQENQKSEVDKQRLILETLKSQRKN